MDSSDATPTVSVVVLNDSEPEHVSACLSHLEDLDYPRDCLDVVLADSHSTDGSVERIRRQFPRVRVLECPPNLGSAGSRNWAVAHSQAAYVAFLGADTRVGPGWLGELVQIVGMEEGVVCAASKMLTWDGKLVDYAGDPINFYGYRVESTSERAYRPGENEHRRVVPFACAEAMLIDRQVFLSCGGFDEDYVAHMEDVDLGWRLGLLGYQVVLAPKAIVYHRQADHWKGQPAIHRLALQERNALYTVIKNYEDVNLDRVLTLALFLSVKRAIVDSEINPNEYSPTFAGLAAQRKRANVPKAAFAPLIAVDQVVENLPRLLEKRARIQSQRCRNDSAFYAQFAEGMLLPSRSEPPFVATQSTLLRNWPVPDFFRRERCEKLLIVCHDTVGAKMAGPAIRYWELARALSRHYSVTLAAPGRPEREGDQFRVQGYERMNEDSIQPLLADVDVILTYAYLLNELPVLGETGKPLILDLYDPYVLENLETFDTLPEQEQQAKHDAFLAALNHQMVAGDFFICASERQRHFWLGMLAANHRVNPSTYEQDKSLRKLIDVVPFGIPSRPPRHSRQVLKGVWPGIDAEDKVILWGGGIWDWFDPLTLIRAMDVITRQRADVKLFFMAKGHFDPSVVPEADMAEQAVRLSKKLGLLNRSVFFGDWVPYDERESYLLEADIGVSLHLEHLEARFSFRTRLLDYIWAGLPAVITKGDYLGDLLAARGLGRSVAQGDVQAIADAILELLSEPGLRQRLEHAFADLAETFRWERVAQPIAAFCQQPWMAPDRAWLSVDVTRPAIKPSPWWTLPGKAWHYVRRGGPGALLRAVRMYVRWLRVIRRRQAGEEL